MKKLLMIILAILLIWLTYVLVLKDITIANWNNKSVGDIKGLNENLKEQIGVATQLNNQDYPNAIENIDKSIEDLKIAKEKYDNKIANLSNNVELGIVKIKEYKIERLWIVLENYAKDENVELKLEIMDSATQGAYDLNVTVIGSYIGITDFIYDIEKDDTLGFKILNFKLVPNTTVTTSDQTNTTATVDANKLRATFTIENVGIEFN